MWQPIETIPMDGRVVLVIGGVFPVIPAHAKAVDPSTRSVECFALTQVHGQIPHGTTTNVTHWMPLPEPPHDP